MPDSLTPGQLHAPARLGGCTYPDCSTEFEQKSRGRKRKYCDRHSSLGTVEAHYARKYGEALTARVAELEARLVASEYQASVRLDFIDKLERELRAARSVEGRP